MGVQPRGRREFAQISARISRLQLLHLHLLTQASSSALCRSLREGGTRSSGSEGSGWGSDAVAVRGIWMPAVAFAILIT
jgi:hypothetical protein